MEPASDHLSRARTGPEKLDSILEGLARMTEVIRSDEVLKRTFLSLAEKNPEERRGMIAMMSERMLADGKDPDLVAVFRLLSDARVFAPALQAVSSD